MTGQVVPVLSASVKDGPHSTGQPVWQELASALVGLASASQNFDANGPWIRYLFGIGANTLSFGELGGAEHLLTAQGTEVVGANPRWFGNDFKLPFRPDQKCVDQGKPNLQARTGMPVQSARMVQRNSKPSVKPATLEQLKALLGDRSRLRKLLSAGRGD